MRQRRYPLLLDTDYPPEQAVLRAIDAIPDGERAAFLRALILLGHREMARDTQLTLITRGTQDHGTGTH